MVLEWRVIGYILVDGYLFICKNIFFIIILIKRDNTCEINLMDIVEKKEVKPDSFEKGGFEDKETLAGK